MRSLWRIFLACMLLVAVPLKGMAAVGMVDCSPWPSGGDPVSHHSPVGGAQAHHAAPTTDDVHAGASHTHTPHADHQGADPGPDDCSQCAPCCFAAMFLSTFELPAPAWQKHFVRAPAELSYPSTHLPGLDRPPRAFPA